MPPTCPGTAAEPVSEAGERSYDRSEPGFALSELWSSLSNSLLIAFANSVRPNAKLRKPKARTAEVVSPAVAVGAYANPVSPNQRSANPAPPAEVRQELVPSRHPPS